MSYAAKRSDREQITLIIHSKITVSGPKSQGNYLRRLTQVNDPVYPEYAGNNGGLPHNPCVYSTKRLNRRSKRDMGAGNNNNNTGMISGNTIFFRRYAT